MQKPKKPQKTRMTIEKLAAIVADGFTDVMQRLDNMTKRIDGIDTRLDGIDIKMATKDDIKDMATKSDIAALDIRLAKVEIKLNTMTPLRQHDPLGMG